MANVDKAQQLTNLVADLHKERQEHADAIAEIDATLDQFGIDLEKTSVRRRPGRPAGRKKVATTRGKKKVSKKKVSKKKVRRGGRKSYGQTADEFVLGLVGSTPMTTKEINDAWKAAGRKGKADNTLTKLTKEKELNRKNLKGARGSQYTAA